MSTSSHRQHRSDLCWDMVRRNYYDRGWRHAYTVFAEAVGQVVSPGGSVLDAGCGRDFPLAEFLLSLGADVHGVDAGVIEPSPQAPVTTFCCAVDRMPYNDDSFDVIVSRCLLEHLARPEDALGEFNRVLRPGGSVLFLTPNRFDYVSIGAAMLPHRIRSWMLNRLEGRDHEDAFPVYYRANSMSRIRRLAGRTDFTVDYLQYHNCYPALFMHHPLLCRLGIAWDNLVTRVKGLNWLQGWLLGRLTSTKTATEKVSANEAA